ncbi:MAG: class I SAM-dependent methyltransferase [Acidimicrobiales bacterium]
MLTVDYDLLGLRPGELVLDMGAGAGRHAFETYRRGARIIALDYSLAELKDVASLFAAMDEAREAPAGGMATTVNGDARTLPFPDATFDRIITSEVLEHIDEDVTALDELARVLKPGGTLAATVPTWFPEKVCWAITDEYHAPFVEGGHVRVYTEGELRRKVQAAGLTLQGVDHAHALHSPYWWLKCAVGPTKDEHPLVKAYHRLLVWEMVENPLVLRAFDRVLNPVLGKSLILYATRPLAATPYSESFDANA